MRTLAGWCVRHRRLVVLLWLLVLVTSIFTVEAVGTNYSNNFNFPHTQSFDAINLLEVGRPRPFGRHRTGRLRHLRRRPPDRPRRRPAHQHDGGQDQRAAQRDRRHQPLRRRREPRQHDQHQRRPDGRLPPGAVRQAAQQHLEERGQDLRRHGHAYVGRRPDGGRHRPAGRAGQQPVLRQHRARRAPGADRVAARVRFGLRRHPPDPLRAARVGHRRRRHRRARATSSACPRSHPSSCSSSGWVWASTTPCSS